MAAVVDFQFVKSDMAASIPLPSPVTKTNYTRLSIVNYSRTSRSASLRALSWGTARGEYLFPPVNRLSLLPRPLLNGLGTHNRPMTTPVFCSMDPAGSTDYSFRKFKVDVKKWCDKQCLPVGAVVYTLFEAFQSAVFGVVWKVLTDRFVIYMPISELELMKPSLGIYYPLALSVAESPFIVARSYAVITSCITSTTYVMKRLRSKREDILTFMVPGFVTPVMYSLVAGMRSYIIIPIGLICALLCGLIFKVVDHVRSLYHHLQGKRNNHKQKMKARDK